MLNHNGTNDYLWPRYKEETAGQQQTLHGGLTVTELDAVQVQDALTVR